MGQAPRWVNDLERTFSEAQLDTIRGSEEIFGVLRGEAPDYDLQLFDALAEVRLTRWARVSGYHEIEKLQTIARTKTPDFRMKQNGQTILAEAKHFRVRDYLPDFVHDRLEGLALKTGVLTRFGLNIEADERYDQERDRLLGACRSSLERGYRERARCELTEDWLSSLERQFRCDEDAQVPILDGLLTVKRNTRVGSVELSQTGFLDPTKTVRLCLVKLFSELTVKLMQIKGFWDDARTDATQAVVFFSGIDPWQPEWDALWDVLFSRNKLSPEESRCAWDCVRFIREAATALINPLPFELIVGKGNPVQYGPLLSHTSASCVLSIAASAMPLLRQALL